MKHNDGIEVFLQARGTRFREFTNPYSHRSENYHGAFGSRIISAKPTTEFDVVVRFDSRFRWYSSDGVLITIAIHPGDGVLTERVQSTWLDIHHIYGDHLFSTYALFTSREDHAGVIQECMRIPVCYRCISIQVERGKLAESLDNQRSPKWLLTDPPRLCLDLALPRRLVRREWFRELRSESGLPYLFEYRNVPPEHIGPNQVEAAPEIEHESDCDSDVEFERTSNKRLRQSDPWGAEDYQGDSDFEANHQVLSNRGGVSIRSSKRRRGAAGENADHQANATHIEQSNPLDGGSKYRFILPAVPHHRAVETLRGSTLGVFAKRRLSRRQEPTPPPERSKAVRIATNFGEVRSIPSAQSPGLAQPPQSPPVYQPPAVPQPPAITQSPALTESNTIVDLTSDDERPMKIENEPVVEHSPPVVPPDTTEGGSEDISDLEDQLAEIQLRRKIRAAKRKKEEARLRNVLQSNAVDCRLD